MHAADILRYGHQTVLQCVDGLPEQDWNISGACGIWSVREIIAHLASYEHLLFEILQSLLDGESRTPLLQQLAEEGLAFNDSQVEARKEQSPAESWEEYEAAYHKNESLFKRIPLEQQRQAGLLSWYGQEYDLEDYLVYSFYGHKREHGAQVNAFRDILNQQKAADIYA